MNSKNQINIDSAENTQPAHSKDSKKHLIFSLGGKRYGIPLFLIKEVIGPCDITSVPKVAKYYKGLINLRGQIISVIDLRLKFNVPDEFSKETAIIIAHVGDIEVGLIIDEVIEVVGYKSDQVDYAEPEKMNRIVEGVYGVAKDASGSLTLLLNIEKSLDVREFNVLTSKNAM